MGSNMTMLDGLNLWIDLLACSFQNFVQYFGVGYW